jgi:hypothetical protein
MITVLVVMVFLFILFLYGELKFIFCEATFLVSLILILNRSLNSLKFITYRSFTERLLSLHLKPHLFYYNLKINL